MAFKWHGFASPATYVQATHGFCPSAVQSSQHADADVAGTLSYPTLRKQVDGLIAAQDATGGGAAPIVGATKSDASKRARSIRRPCVRSDSVCRYRDSSSRVGAKWVCGCEEGGGGMRKEEG